MNKRSFLIKTGLLLTSECMLAGTSRAQNTPSVIRDYSKVEQSQQILAPVENRYQYSQTQLSVLKAQEGLSIETNILPNQYDAYFWNKPRELFLQNSKTNEKINIVYYSNNRVNLQGYWWSAYFLRDVRANSMLYPDLKLLDLMCAVQAWMRVYGNYQPLIITSGYRSATTNSMIEGAVKNSMHLVGKAVDFIVPGMDSITIGKIATHFKAGGVGIGIDKNFNHLDTSRVRTWYSRAKAKR